MSILSTWIKYLKSWTCTRQSMRRNKLSSKNKQRMSSKRERKSLNNNNKSLLQLKLKHHSWMLMRNYHKMNNPQQRPVDLKVTSMFSNNRLEHHQRVSQEFNNPQKRQNQSKSKTLKCKVKFHHKSSSSHNKWHYL